MTTLAYVVIDTETEKIELVSAGHPPPLVIPPDGEPEYLEGTGGIPLGVAHSARYDCQSRPFSAGSTLVLYTDGLVERRGEELDVGLERLRDASADAPNVETLCADVVARLAPANRADDVALLAVRVPPVPEHLSGRWQADPKVLAGVRSLLRRWLRERGVGDEAAYDIVLASQEACANAIEHAYGPRGGEFELEAVAEDGRVRITVRDEGGWRAPRGGSRGHGMPLMEQLVESIEIERGDDGSTVVLEHPIGAR
jgi:anti-sigma regulatory factor (Ser/Thr protein kinase)